MATWVCPSCEGEDLRVSVDVYVSGTIGTSAQVTDLDADGYMEDFEGPSSYDLDCCEISGLSVDEVDCSDTSMICNDCGYKFAKAKQITTEEDDDYDCEQVTQAGTTADPSFGWPSEAVSDNGDWTAGLKHTPAGVE